MQLSIVIPVYNLEKYIERCLDSCIAQDLPVSDYEIICVNDGSKDGSYDILEKYKEKYSNIKVFHKENEGLVKTRNFGISKANGEYIWFVDGDDWIRKNCLKYMMNAAKLEMADLVLFKEKRVFDYCMDEDAFPEPKAYNGGYAVFSDRLTTCSGFFWFKKSIIDEQNINFDENIYYADDTLFLAKFRPYCKRMVRIDAVIYYYLQRADSVSHAVRYSLHCASMYNLAKQYKELSMCDFKLYKNGEINKKMSRASIQAFQGCFRDLCFYCKDIKFVKDFIKTSQKEGFYPNKIDWESMKFHKNKSKKVNFMNFVFGFSTVKVFFWLLWFVCFPIRLKSGISTFDKKDFEIKN